MGLIQTILKVDVELDRLVSNWVLSPVKKSECGAPIVPVIKSNGTLKICRDFKVTINLFLEEDKHPIPGINNLFVQIDKGDKIDLAHAQLMLSDSS